MNNEEQLQIRPNDSLSINDLVDLHEQGLSVQRSAHVGNLQPYNMSLIAVGIPAILVDHTITGVDTTYRPESILLAGTETSIAPHGQVSSRIKVIDTYVDQAHTDAVLSAIPHGNIELTTAYIRRHEAIYRDVTRIAVESMPELFKRKVENGDPVTSEISTLRAQSEISRCGILQLNDDPRSGSGVLMPNVVDIVGNFIAEALESGRDTVYHLSGPDMVRYIFKSKDAQQIAQLYALVKGASPIGKHLPAKLKVELVPTADARLATTLQRANELDQLMQAVVEKDDADKEIRTRKAAFFNGPDRTDYRQRDRIISESNTLLGEATHTLIQAASQCPEVLTPYKRSEDNGTPFVSQYDIAEEGGLYIHPLNTELSSKELSRIITSIRKCIRKEYEKTPT